MKPKLKNIFIISGPSGAGEDSIISGLRERFPVEKMITTTTRAMRMGEVHGKDYFFVSLELFQAGIREGRFAEYAQQYNGNLYGITHEELARVSQSGKIGLWKIDYKGVAFVKQHYPDVIAIFVNAPSLEILEQRIRRRDAVTDDYVAERMAYTKEWLNHTDLYDYSVINEEGKLDAAIAAVATIIDHHRASL